LNNEEAAVISHTTFPLFLHSHFSLLATPLLCLQRQESSVKWSSVKPPSPERLLTYEALEEVPDDVELNHALLDRVVVCKLNGGLGTTMGCRGPKSCLEVDDDRTFLGESLVLCPFWFDLFFLLLATEERVECCQLSRCV
jgi:UDP-N-acetylglucosamine pyrophosphorylase